MQPERELTVRIDPPLAWISINRPQAHNAVTMQVWEQLAIAAEGLRERQDVRVVIVRGAGDKAFVVGADITEFPKLRADAAMTAIYDQKTHAALAAIAELPKPVIAMVNGLCFGGGCSVALACDLRFAVEHARFAIPAARLGLSYPFELGVERLVQIVGPAHAADLLLSARAIDATEALRIGLVNQVFGAAGLEDETRTFALRMAEGAPLTLAAHKLAIRSAAAGSKDTAAVRAAAQRCFDSQDYREGTAAFLEKRPPRFRGC